MQKVEAQYINTVDTGMASFSRRQYFPIDHYDKINLKMITPPEYEGLDISIIGPRQYMSSIFDSIGTFYQFEIDSVEFRKVFENKYYSYNFKYIKCLQEMDIIKDFH
jgi:hypothetical protein